MKILHLMLRASLLAPFLLILASLQASAEDLFKQAQGYWIVDFDSATTTGLIKKIAAEEGEPLDEEGMELLRREMAATTFEIQEKILRLHDPHSIEDSKLEIKSQNPEQKLIEAQLTRGDDPAEAARILVMEDRINLSIKQDGDWLEVGLKRIDKAAFDQRIADLAKLPDPDQDKAGDEAAPEAELQDGYPLGIPVPDREGFVFSPYNRQIIDVREIPKGTLVADPTFPPGEGKFFRVP